MASEHEVVILGAINAAYFAEKPDAGGVERLAEVWRRVTRRQIFPLTVRRGLLGLLAGSGGFIQAHGLRRLIATHVPYERLEKALLPCIVVATDLVTGREVGFSKGPVVDLLLASAAIPGVFPPVEIAAVDVRTEGLLMAPAYAIPRLLARHGLRYEEIDLWEIHEAFAAQVLCNLAALEDASFLRARVGREETPGRFPRERVNPSGGSIAIGHPLGATGARILSRATKELAGLPSGSRAVVSICADGGQGTVALLEAP